MPLSLAGVLSYMVGPLSKQVVLFEPGVNSVYGLNGVGKSYLLEAIASYAVGGNWHRGGLLFRFHEPTESDVQRRETELGEITYDRRVRDIIGHWNDLAWTDGLEPSLRRQDIYEALLGVDFPDDSATRPYLGHDLWRPQTFGYAQVPDTKRNRAIIDEVLDNGFLLAQPRQNVNPGLDDGVGPATWTLWPVLLSADGCPVIASEIARVVQMGSDAESNLAPYAQYFYDEGGPNPEPDRDWDMQEEEFLEGERQVLESGFGESLLMNSHFPVRDLGLLPEIKSGWNGPYFLRSIGQLFGTPWSVLVSNVQPRDAAADTSSVESRTRLLLSSTRQQLRGSKEQVWADLLETAAAMSQAATATVAELLIDPFELVLEVGDEIGLLSGEFPRWTAIIPGVRPTLRADGLGLRDLSSAQRRWAEFAIDLVIQAATRRTHGAVDESWLWLLDEPESALHRSAEEHLARGLVSLSQRHRAITVVATHSPELLDDPRTAVLHARMSDGRTTILPMDSIDHAALEELGLRPSDLLRRQRAFIVVEGEHEIAILEALLAADLKALRAHVIAARGARKFEAVFDSQLLFAFTDAPIVVVIDNVSASQIQSVWDEARKESQKGRVDAAADALRAALPGSGRAENVFLQQFLTKALQTGQHERVAVFGMSRPDITEYLPAHSFSRFETWEAARDQWRESGTKKAFKPWLSAAMGSDFSTQHVASVAQELDGIPADLVDLLAYVEAIARR